MSEILINIRNENDYFKRYFKNADTVTLENILTVLDELIYEKGQELENEDDEPDPYDLYMDRKLEEEV